jgi:hypothetical protein
MSLIRMKNIPLEPDMQFSARLQYKFVDEQFSRPLVEKVLFPKGRRRQVSPTEADNFILAHKAKLCNMVAKNSKKSNHRIKSGESFVHLVSLDEFSHEKLSATVSMTIAFPAQITLPNFLTRHLTNRKMVTTVTYVPKKDRLTIKPVFEKHGFNIILEVCHDQRLMTWTSVVDDASGCKQIHLQAVRDTINLDYYDLKNLQVSQQLRGEKTFWRICVLIIRKMEDHLETLRYISNTLNTDSLRKNNSSSYKCVVIVGNTASVLTEKELMKFFQTQDIYLVFSKDIGEDCNV